MINLKTVEQYCRLHGVEARHPLVSVIDMSEVKPICPYIAVFGIYAVFLKDTHCGDLRYGKRTYDYQGRSVVCVAPGQVLGINGSVPVQPSGMALVFHPDLIRGTLLGRSMHRYSFFSYESNEALHLSEEEQGIVIDCFRKIVLETGRPADRHSRRLITANIELLLDYCLRFYERQFVTRAEENKDTLVKFERLLNDYFENRETVAQGLPSVRYFADKVCLSPNYFSDMLKKETGKTAKEYIQWKLIGIAKERVLDPSKSISEVAYGLGFQYPQHFSRLFKRLVGCTPNEYRMSS